MIKGILFDIGGLILPEEDAYIIDLEIEKSALRECGLVFSDQEFDDTVRRCILSFVPSLSKAINWSFTTPDIELFDRVEKTYRSYHRPWSDKLQRTVRPGMADLLESLASRYTLALAANAGQGIRDILEHYDVLRFFSSTLISGDLPYAKPDLRFFMDILANSGLSVNEVIMVGDRLDNDIIPARMLGMRTVLFKVGPYAILEPRAPGEIPDAVVQTTRELARALETLSGG